ncbi:Gaa1-domain-containing protein [Auriscalpium vulgare]|uniref:Gaa1-domain-containing protein n=1 Tax=Auriscalpium vulgare TaxID=40419 RepID=A0ACB8RLP5_9AGAM|nr:Gaa1-domain-containing protein [Auriscalpium vulgare]
MPSLAVRVRSRIRSALSSGDNGAKVRRRRKLTAALWSNLAILRVLLLVAGYAWMLALPSPQLGGSETYIDENALQPAQVNTYWSWGEVRRADDYLAELEALRDRNASSEERARYFVDEFTKLGVPASTQSYSIRSSLGVSRGVNAYAIYTAPRASGTEAIVISASWLSLTDGYNLRGLSTVLALSAFLTRYSHWSKDLIFVLSDSHLDGMHAWLSTYHGSTQSNMQADELELSSGVIWTALNLDYPGHSFSHLGIFREGLNGRLPNQDLLNSVRVIAHHTAGVPVILYDHFDSSEWPGRQDVLKLIPSWVPQPIREHRDVIEYGYRAKNVFRQMAYQARGRASGAHGLFHQYRIDAVTLFAVPSNGPHGFYALGRTVESTLRTMNNLLERLHASFFFYILTTPGKFLKIGMYLPSAVLVAVALMFGGMGEWVSAGWVEIVDDDGGADAKESGKQQKQKRWVTRSRDVVPALGIMIATHVGGALLFLILSSRWFIAQQAALALPLMLLLAAIPLGVQLIFTDAYPAPAAASSTAAPLSLLLKALTLCLASTLISVTSVLNFSLAALLAVVFGAPLSLAGAPASPTAGLLRYVEYAVLALGWLAHGAQVREAVWQWEVLGVWFAPLVCVVYAPIMLQAGIVALLPP